MSRPRPIVVKFGGATLSDPTAVIREIERLRGTGRPVIVVVSAREGITDLLFGLARRPMSPAGRRRAFRRLARAHPGGPEIARLRRGTERLAEQTAGRPTDPASTDRLVSQGERLAAAWLAETLRGAGVPATAVEADRLGLVTDNVYGSARILLGRSRRRVARGLADLLEQGTLPVVTGYFGRSREGKVATLGRGGSDYAASAIGAIVRASRVELVKRDVSIYSADPRLVDRPIPLRRLSYEEAEELSQFGARVLHPYTIEPLRALGIPLLVRSLNGARGTTEVGPWRNGGRLRAVAMLRSLDLYRLRVPGGRQRPGVIAEVTDRLRAHDVNVVQLYTSSTLLCLVVDRAASHRAETALRPLRRAAEATLDGPRRVSLAIAIGDGIVGDLGRIPTEILAQGEGVSATPRAVSIAVPEGRERRVLTALHHALVRGARR